MEFLSKPKSLDNIGHVVNSRLQELELNQKEQAKPAKKQGIDKYLMADGADSDSSADSFEAAQDASTVSLQTTEQDATKLIDIELIKLLKYCFSLQEVRESDDYQGNLIDKSIELGKKTHDKLLIFDMDETLIAAKQGDKLPDKF